MVSVVLHPPGGKLSFYEVIMFRLRAPAQIMVEFKLKNSSLRFNIDNIQRLLSSRLNLYPGLCFGSRGMLLRYSLLVRGSTSHHRGVNARTFVSHPWIVSVWSYYWTLLLRLYSITPRCVGHFIFGVESGPLSWLITMGIDPSFLELSVQNNFLIELKHLYYSTNTFTT